MRNRASTGQEAIEFVMISIFVFFACLGVLYIFGEKLSTLFNENTGVFRNAKNSTRIISAETSKYSNNIQTTNYSAQNNTTENNSNKTTSNSNNRNYELTTNADGSTTFSMNGNSLVLPKSLIEESDQVFQTIASSGDNKLIELLADMMTTYEDEIEAGSEVNIIFGDSTAISGDIFSGSATQNLISVSVGNHYGIIQKDQECLGICTEEVKQRKIFLDSQISTGQYTGTISEFSTSTNEYVNKTDITAMPRTSSDGGYIEEVQLSLDDLMLIMNFKQPNIITVQ